MGDDTERSLRGSASVVGPLLDLKTRSKTPIPGTGHVWSVDISDDGKRALLTKWRDKTPCPCLNDLK